MTISLSSPDITQAEIALVNQVLQTTRLSMGPMLERFETLIAAFAGAQHAVAVSSGTAGLHLALIAAGVEPGDLVLTTPFSFVASANCILYRQAVPVFVDIDPQTMNIDPALATEAVEELVNRGTQGQPWAASMAEGPSHTSPRLKALLPVHVFGQPCDMDPLTALAGQYDLMVVEDACEALGAEYNHRPVGGLAHCGIFAFYPNKQMTTGEGGIITTNDSDWADLFRSLRNQGRDESASWLNHVRLGYNYRMDELSAALGVAQIERIEELLAKRSQVAAWYDQQLAGVDGVTAPGIAPTTTRMSWFVYVVRLAPEVDRDVVMERLSRESIPSRAYFPPIHLQPLYQERFGYREGAFPITEAVARSTLALPFHGLLAESEVHDICRALDRAISRS